MSYVRGGASWTSETRFGYNMNDSHNVNMSFTKPVLDAAHPKEDFLYGRRLGRLSTNLGWGTLAGNQDLLLEGPTWSLGEKFSKHFGKHSLKFGGLFTHHCCQRDNVEAVGWTYSGLPDLLANIPSQINASFGNGEYTAKMWELGFFLQDDWRVSSNLTLNLGLRYDYFSRMVAREDKSSGSFLFNPNGLIDDKFSVGAMRPTNDPYDSDRVNFGPRFGFAYNIRGKGKTVIRGGTGFIYSPQVIGNMWNLVGTKYAPKRILFSRQDAITLGLKYPMYNDDLRKVVERQAIAEGFTNIFQLEGGILRQPAISGARLVGRRHHQRVAERNAVLEGGQQGAAGKLDGPVNAKVDADGERKPAACRQANTAAGADLRQRCQVEQVEVERQVELAEIAGAVDSAQRQIDGEGLIGRVVVDDVARAKDGDHARRQFLHGAESRMVVGVEQLVDAGGSVAIV